MVAEIKHSQEQDVEDRQKKQPETIAHYLGKQKGLSGSDMELSQMLEGMRGDPEKIAKITEDYQKGYLEGWVQYIHSQLVVPEVADVLKKAIEEIENSRQGRSKKNSE